MKRIVYLLMIFAAISCSTSSTPEPDTSGGNNGGGQGTGGDGNGQGGGSGNDDPSFTLPDVAVSGNEGTGTPYYIVNWDAGYTNRTIRKLEDYFGERASLTTIFGPISNFLAAGSSPNNVYQFDASSDTFQKFEGTTIFDPSVSLPLIYRQFQSADYFTIVYMDGDNFGDYYVNAYEQSTAKIENFFLGNLPSQPVFANTTYDLLQLYTVDNGNSSDRRLHLMWLKEGTQFEINMDEYIGSLYIPFLEQVFLFEDTNSSSYDIFDLRFGSISGSGSMDPNFRAFDFIMDPVFVGEKMFYDLRSNAVDPAYYDFSNNRLTTFQDVDLYTGLFNQYFDRTGTNLINIGRIKLDLPSETFQINGTLDTGNGEEEHVLMFVDFEGTLLDFVNTGVVQMVGVIHKN